MHPTVKPVALVMDAIRDCSRRNGVILDPFGGSGTTLMAAERTNRIARMIEFDPLYVDLIIQRWQTLTGGSAVLENSGKSFEEVSRTRTVMRKS
jgi:DNA modification methylase